MNNIEEKLWDYIDGNCTPEEQKAIGVLIAHDDMYHAKYEELQMLNKEFAAMEVDEPPMAFTYNVMEEIRTEYARQPLKATINKRIIIGITGFLALNIAVLLVYILVSINWSAASASTESLHVSIKMPDLGKYFTKPVIEGILFFYVISALVLFDAFLRRKQIAARVH